MRINKNFRVKGQHITCTDDTRIIKGNKNLYYAVFHVDELWDGIELKACFTVDEEPYIMPLERIGKTLECEIPYPANSGVVFGVGIFGGDLISTDIVYASTTPGIPIDGENPPEPVPDWFNKMEGIAKQAMETANSIKEQADSGAFNGKPFTYDDFTEEQLKALEGYTPQKNIDYFDGKDGADGKDGQNGTDGKDGYTPQKGLDYFTSEEVNEIVRTVLSQVESTEFEETDPTVPDWAKAAEKPTYTAEEVGARPDTWMPTASDVGARPSTWTPSASEVGADPSGTAVGTVSSHNTAENAHADIRELIEQITTGKVNVSDIIDNLTTNVANKPLSAAQGVALKKMIDAITVPTKVSQLENDRKYLTQHQDISGKANASELTTHTSNTTVHVTAQERTAWNKNTTDISNLSEEKVGKNEVRTIMSEMLIEAEEESKNIFSFEDGDTNISILSKNKADTNYISATSANYGYKDTDNGYYVCNGIGYNYGIAGAMPLKPPTGSYLFSAEIFIPSGNTTRTNVFFGACTFPADSSGVFNLMDTYDLGAQDQWVKVEKTISVTDEHTAVYVSFKNYIDNYPFYLRNIKVISLEPELSGWEGKKWVAVGDSITEKNSKTLKNYHDYIAESTGIAVVNMGLSGTGYKAKESTSEAFYQRISNVPTDADVITIFGSGNDLGGSYTIGEVTDTGTDTLCGCINTTIDNLFSIMPMAQLGIITSIPWRGFNPSDDTNLMAQYSAKIVEICRRRGIPCLDLYHCSGMRPWDSSFQEVAYPLNSSGDGRDGVHPNEVGHAFFAPKIKSFLASLIM